MIGGLSAIGKIGGGSFSTHDLDLFTLFANQVSIAIENARLFQDHQNIIGKLKQEISKRKKIQTALEKEKEQLAITLRSIGDGVITTDTDGKVVLINKVAEKLCGWSQSEACGKPLAEVFRIISEETREPRDNPAETILKTGEIIEIANHTALIARNGTERSIADSGAPIRDKSSQIIGVVLVFRDVTESNRLKDELLKVKKLESVGVLAGGIAHDFNNILVAILGNINLASQIIGDDNHQVYPLLKDAEKASLRAKDLTQQLLTFSQGGEPVRKTAAIPEVIKDSADFVLRGSNVACQYHIADDLWLVEIDKGQISQVIQNLILNASHAMPQGGNIQISCENIKTISDPGILLPRKNNYLKITISDSGIGIPKNIIDKIFDPYFSTKQKGSGLGLAITHSIISKHDGHISVCSKLGEGTTFTIYLPASSKEPQSLIKSTEIPPVGKATIMIMDDDEMVRTLAQRILSQFGYEVVLAEDGKEAIQLYENAKDSPNPIDLIIMDLTIPGGMGGKEAIEKIHQINPEAKVIVTSGYSNDPIMANHKEYGFCATITKPFMIKELIRLVSQVLS
ncbi:MAG: response regulator [Proteobacteria bacterium]|nr:response regulator [Pseudomonadota bacterium]MBU1716552.1 response regulator [Pseudomonadota bacterium]